MASIQTARSALRASPSFARMLVPRVHRPAIATQVQRNMAARAAEDRGLERRQRGRSNNSLTPFRSPWDLMDLVDPLFDSSMTHPLAELSKTMRNVPIDIVEKADSYAIKADIPGVVKDAINLEVDGDTISLSVREESEKMQPEQPAEGETVHRMERSSSFVRRTVRLPEAADMDKVAAGYKDGVLTLTVPKKEHAVARRRTIDIASE